MLDIVLAPMALEPKTFSVGDKVRVTVSFKYTVGINSTVKIYAGPYYTNLFGKHMVDTCVGEADVPLIASSTPADETAAVDFILVPKASGGIDNGTYGLRVWVDGTNADVAQDNVLVVSGNPAGATDTLSAMMPMLMMLMMMGMVVPMAQQMGEGSEEA